MSCSNTFSELSRQGNSYTFDLVNLYEPATNGVFNFYNTETTGYRIEYRVYYLSR